MHHHPSTTTTTTFSSSLLNHIFLSIDDHHHDPDPPADHHDRPISALRRSRLLHKWMDKPNSPSFTPVVPPPPPRRRPSPPPPPPPVVPPSADEDPDSFFSTTSVSSSDSSSGGLSFSETPSFDPSSKPKSSCFGPLRAPRPVKTKPTKPDDPSQDNDHNSSTNRSSASSRAAKLYSQLKSLKQPISPGLKLAKYINSLTKKKTTKNSPDRKFRGIPVPDRRYNSEQASPEWCISAPKKLGNESSVPAAADIKAGSRPALMKRYEELRRLNTADVRQEDDHDDDDDDKTDLNRKVLEEVALDLLNGYWTRRRNEENADRERHDDDDDDDKDDSSCSSSDLFEIDHLSVIGSSELPVYETTTTTTTASRIN